MTIFIKKVVNQMFATIFQDTGSDLAASFSYKALIISFVLGLSAVAIFTLIYFN